MIKIAIVDDEKYVCEHLKQLLIEYQFKYNLDFKVDIFLSCEDLFERVWNCQGMCSQRIPKILDRQISGSVMSQPC